MEIKGKEEVQEKKVKRKMKIFERYIVLIIIATLFLGIAYAEVSDIKLTITGSANASKTEGLQISNVSVSSTSGVSSQEVKYYSGTTLSTSVELSTDTTSNIIYEISLINNTEEKYYFKGVTYNENAYDNTNITYSLDGIEPYVTTIDSKGTMKFTLQFKYPSGIILTSNQTLNSMLNFEFSNEMIEFTVDGTKYTAPSGATWQQFVDSEYNTAGFKITSGKVYTSTNEQIYILENAVNSTDIIAENTAYNYKIYLTLDKETLSVQILSGSTGSATLTATINVDVDLTWTSSNTSVANVTGNGNIGTLTLKSAGTTVITVSYGEHSASCTVTVSTYVECSHTYTSNKYTDKGYETNGDTHIRETICSTCGETISYDENESCIYNIISNKDGTHDIACILCGVRQSMGYGIVCNFSDGVCSECGYICNHSSVSHSDDYYYSKCLICGEECNHSFFGSSNGNGTHDMVGCMSCDLYNGTLSENETCSFENGVCTVCSYECTHADKYVFEISGGGRYSTQHTITYYCNTCYESWTVTEYHKDADGDSICDVCDGTAWGS